MPIRYKGPGLLRCVDAQAGGVAGTVSLYFRTGQSGIFPGAGDSAPAGEQLTCFFRLWPSFCW